MRTVIKQFLYLLLPLLLVLNMGSAYAEDEETEEATDPETVYVDLLKAFIVTLADPGKMRYLKTNIQIVVVGDDMADKIRFHFPTIRNELILLLSSKTRNEIKSVDLRETLKDEALERLNTRLAELDQSIEVEDLLYITFIVQ